MLPQNKLPTMGRKKGYKAPEGLIRIPGSPFWWIKIGKVRKSTKVPLDNITKATIILREIQKRLLEREDRVREMMGESVPFSQLVGKYLKEISSGKRSGKSDEVNSKWPLKYFGERKIDSIRPLDIAKYQDWRKEQISERKGKPVSGATINREKSFISACFKKAIRWGYVEANPCKDIERFPEKKRKRYITDEEFQKIKESAKANKMAAHLPDIMDMLYLTGLREGRVLNLKWEQINLKERYIVFEDRPENKGVPDRIWINDRLMSLLKRLRGERFLKKVVGQYVFQKNDGSKFGSIRKAWETACKKAGVEDARIHDIRHKTATDLGDMGFSPSQIAKVLGHSGTSMTDRYTHLQSTKEMLEVLGK